MRESQCHDIITVIAQIRYSFLSVVSPKFWASILIKWQFHTKRLLMVMLGIRNLTTKLDVLHFLSITLHLLTRYMCLFVILLNSCKHFCNSTLWSNMLIKMYLTISQISTYRVNKWSVTERKCKTSSFVVKFRIPSITINNLFVWNCHFIKIDAQYFGDTTDRKLYLIWAITVIIQWYWDYRKRLIIISWLI